MAFNPNITARRRQVAQGDYSQRPMRGRSFDPQASYQPPPMMNNPGNDVGSYPNPNDPRTKPTGGGIIDALRGKIPGGNEGGNPDFDYNGFPAPAWTLDSWGAAPAGFDPEKWADKNYWSPKYAVGRLMTAYDTRSPEFLQALQRMYPGATLDGDGLQLPFLPYMVDIFQDEEGARLPQWLTPDQEGGSGGPGGAMGGDPGMGGAGGFGSLLESLQGLLGGFDNGRVDAMTEAAQRRLDQYRDQTLANDRSELAARGLAGSGAEISSLANLDAQIADSYGSTLRDIFADEGANASERSIAGLRAGTDLQMNQLDNAVRQMLGMANVGLGYYTADQDYSLGLGNLGLGRDQLGFQYQNMNWGNLLELIRMYLSGVQGSQGGYQ